MLLIITMAFSALDSEFDDLETPPRYRPESVQYFCRTTGFTESEIKKIYRNFKTECPTGLIKEDAFRGIYSQFFPQGGNVSRKKKNKNTYTMPRYCNFHWFCVFCFIAANISQYAHYVFQSLDHERNGILNFEVSTSHYFLDIDTQTHQTHPTQDRKSVV